MIASTAAFMLSLHWAKWGRAPVLLMPPLVLFLFFFLVVLMLLLFLHPFFASSSFYIHPLPLLLLLLLKRWIIGKKTKVSEWVCVRATSHFLGFSVLWWNEDDDEEEEEEKGSSINLCLSCNFFLSFSSLLQIFLSSSWISQANHFCICAAAAPVLDQFALNWQPTELLVLHHLRADNCRTNCRSNWLSF